MNTNKNIAINYASQIYIILIGIAFVPQFARSMGAEAYGLVGFYIMLQTWFNLLDIGFSSTISRETTKYQAGVISSLEYLQVFRFINLFFITIALIGGFIIWNFSPFISSRWLNLEDLPREDIIIFLKIISFIVALRLLCGFYRGVLLGADQQVFLSVFSAFIASIKFIGVMGSMSIWGFTPKIFFIHQLIITIFEINVFMWRSWKLMPYADKLKKSEGFAFRKVYPLIKFALSVAVSSSIWVFVTQTDKLVLSGILSLSEYGYFTIAVMLASGIMLTTGPISTVLMPKMARLHAEGKSSELVNLYKHCTKLASVIAGTVAITMGFCAEPLVFAWSGDEELAYKVSPILRLYAIGNGFLIISSFPFYLQYAIGNLRLHLIGNIIIGFLLIPSVIYVANIYGAIGAGWVWLVYHFLGLILWSGYIHAKIFPGLHKKWFIECFLLIIIPSILFTYLINTFFSMKFSRFDSILYVIFIGLLNLSLTSIIFLMIGKINKNNIKRCIVTP